MQKNNRSLESDRLHREYESLSSAALIKNYTLHSVTFVGSGSLLRASNNLTRPPW
jgi:hypothetical protein